MVHGTWYMVHGARVPCEVFSNFVAGITRCIVQNYFSITRCIVLLQRYCPQFLHRAPECGSHYLWVYITVFTSPLQQRPNFLASVRLLCQIYAPADGIEMLELFQERFYDPALQAI